MIHIIQRSWSAAKRTVWFDIFFVMTLIDNDWPVPYCKDSLFFANSCKEATMLKKSFANYLDHSEMLICCTEDGLVHNFFITIDGGAVAYPLCKDNLFLQIWIGTMQSKAKASANITRTETWNHRAMLKKKHGCRFKNGVEVRADGPISSSQGNYGGVKVTQVIPLQTLMETQRWNDQ